MKLFKLLKELYDERVEKSILNSHPSQESMKKFNEVTGRVGKLFNSKIMERNIMYNTDNNNSSMFKPSVIANAHLTQHIGEYKQDNFKEFTKQLAQFYENAGFKVKTGFGIDEIKGFEVLSEDGEVLGEVDFLEKGAIPNHGHTIIIKQKSNKF